MTRRLSLLLCCLPALLHAEPAREIIIAQNLRPYQQVALATNHSAAQQRSVLLFDNADTHAAVLQYHERWKPTTTFLLQPTATVADHPNTVPLPWPPGQPLPPAALEWFPDAKSGIVCTATDRTTQLHAGRLAIARRVPFVLLGPDDLDAAIPWLRAKNWTDTTWIGPAPPADAKLPGNVTVQASAPALTGPVKSLVVANPHDADRGDLSRWAAWIAGNRDAALILTDPDGKNANELLAKAAADPALRDADAVFLIGSFAALPMLRRANPIVGKDEFIELEPGTPETGAAHTWAIGRLLHEQPAMLPLWLARDRLLVPGPKRAFVASNPGSSLNLLETFSRTSAKEIANAGYETTARFGSEVSPRDLRLYLTQSDLYLWEGHHNTLIKDWGFATWTEPLPPSLIVLQSCLALAPEKALPLVNRGSVAVVGSSTRIYSATGGSFALAYLDALLYDGQSFGGGLREGKNFLLAYTVLKQQRLGENMRLAGANLRSSWAFSLWGDPTLHLPTAGDGTTQPPLKFVVDGDTVKLKLPVAVIDKSQPKYQVAYRPNSRMAGFLHATEDAKQLVSMAFAEIPCPECPADQEPKFAGKIAASQVVSVWDSRRKVASVLVLVQKDTAHEIALKRTYGPRTPVTPPP